MTTPGGGMTREEALIAVRVLWGPRAYVKYSGGWCRVGVICPQGPLGFGNDVEERGTARTFALAIAKAERDLHAAQWAKDWSPPPLAGRAARREAKAKAWCERQDAIVARSIGAVDISGTVVHPGMSPKEQSETWQEVKHLAGLAHTDLANAYDWVGLAESHEHEMVRAVKAGDDIVRVGAATASALYGWAWDEYRDSVRCYRWADRFLSSGWQLLASCVSRLRHMADRMGAKA